MMWWWWWITLWSHHHHNHYNHHHIIIIIIIHSVLCPFSGLTGASSSLSPSSSNHHHIIFTSSSWSSHHDHHIIIISIAIIITIIIIINLRKHQLEWSFVRQPGRPILAILTNRKSGDGWKNKIISCKSGHSFKNAPTRRSKWHPPFQNWSTLRLSNHNLLSAWCGETPCINLKQLAVSPYWTWLGLGQIWKQFIHK